MFGCILRIFRPFGDVAYWVIIGLGFLLTLARYTGDDFPAKYDEIGLFLSIIVFVIGWVLNSATITAMLMILRALRDLLNFIGGLIREHCKIK